MFVLKFGGTSVGSVESIRKVKSILDQRIVNGDRLFVVVSAFSGVTNQLEEILNKAESREIDYEQILELEDRHTRAIRELVDTKNQDAVLAQIHTLVKELKELLSRISIRK